MKLGLCSIAVLLAVPAVATPLPTNQAQQLLLNFDLASPKTPSFVGFEFEFGLGTSPDTVWFDIYGDSNGQTLIEEVRFNGCSYMACSGTTGLWFLRSGPIFAPLNDGVFSVGLWQDAGTAEFLSGAARGYYVTPLGYVGGPLFQGSPIPSPVPEPTSWAMMATGFCLAAVALRQRRRAPVAFI